MTEGKQLNVITYEALVAITIEMPFRLDLKKLQRNCKTFSSGISNFDSVVDSFEVAILAREVVRSIL